MRPTMTPEEFLALIQSISTRDTASDPAGWTPQNPLYGHCAAIAVLAQDVFGGELLRASLLPFPEFAHMGSHYWNRLPDGQEIDFTAAQFYGRLPKLTGELRTRQYVLYDPTTGNAREIFWRYKRLALRLVKIRSGNNTLFDDPIYQQCFFAALDSGCQKMKFGCVIQRKGIQVHAGTNKKIPELSAQCEAKCIRFSITSRTESMLGACAHAEEGMWDLVHKGIPLAECELYIAGFYPDGMPWFKKTAEHTCLRCAVQIHNARLEKIWVPVIDHWEHLSTADALRTAQEYALQIKKV